MLKLQDAWLFHDDLSTFNDAVYFHDFAAHAGPCMDCNTSEMPIRMRCSILKVCLSRFPAA